jgi:hypothetical protein
MFLAGYAIAYRLDKAMRDTYIRIPDKYHVLVHAFITANFYSKVEKIEVKDIDDAIVLKQFEKYNGYKYPKEPIIYIFMDSSIIIIFYHYIVNFLNQNIINLYFYKKRSSSYLIDLLSYLIC